jgi:hypothetical protein
MKSVPSDGRLSFLTLERYALGELSQERCREVEARLAESERDRMRLAAIRGDSVELLPLPTPLAPTKARRPALWAGLGGALAAAALALLVFLAPGEEQTLGHRTKGGDVALVLVGEQHGAEATTFAQGERFKLLVTCPPDLTGSLRAAVYQGGALYQPLADGGPRACANRAAWPGAFALDGRARAWVCVRWDDGPWPASVAALGENTRCHTLAPAQ